jgi:hypothetical protein
MRIQTLAKGLLAAAALATAWPPARAHACTCDPSPFYASFTEPKDGAKDVPLNFAPVLMGAFVPGSVTVEDGLAQKVDITVNEGPAAGCPGTWAEIVPKQPWAPSTTYTIRVKPMHPDSGLGKDSSTFVTGVASLPEPDLPLPKTRASLLTGLPGDGAACASFNLKTCINVEGQTEERRDVELIVRRGDRVMLRTLMWANDMDFGFIERPDCLELRRRSPTGQRSKPVTLCGDDLPATKLANPSARWDAWPRCENGRFVEQRASQSTSDVPRPDASPAGTGGSQPTSAPDDAESSSDQAARSDDDSSPAHREYGCAAVSTTPRTRAPVAMLVAVAAGAVVRSRRRAKRA